MLYLLRHLASILLLPFTATVIIPLWLLSSDPNPASAPQLATARVLVLAAGTAALILGLTLFISTVLHFVRTGRGTLAPWDPTRHLVVVGPYRFVRNPMISAVLIILIGESLFLGSRVIALWLEAVRQRAMVTDRVGLGRLQRPW